VNESATALREQGGASALIFDDPADLARRPDETPLGRDGRS